MLSAGPASDEVGSVDRAPVSMTMVLYIDISELAPAQSDGDPREESMVSLSLLDPNQNKSQPSFSMTVPRNSLPELFLRMYYKFREMDDESLRKLEQALLEDRSVSRNSGRRFPQWLERVRNILEQRFAEPYKLSEIAAETGVPFDRVYELFISLMTPYIRTR